ncbi:MAG: HAD-IG family 5'-nucleotidase [Polyangiales bacterium]
MQLSLPLPEIAQMALGPPGPDERVYSNRSVRMDHIDWVGFDMDYTLAVYRQSEMDRLSIDATIDKLVARGYPKHLRDMRYRTDFPIRGLLVDRKLGNILKMDRYKYVKRAYHGLKELSLEERRIAYHTRRLRPASERYHWVDTLYGLSEVAVYAAAIECLEEEGAAVDYDALFGDVRECIDQSHQDGTILNHIMADHSRYVQRDPDLARTLHHLRSSGKRLFVLTNSYPEYTERMMEFLLDGELHPYTSWRSYFDLVVTASKKPVFFTEERPFFEVQEDYEDWRETAKLERGKLYAGGNQAALMEALDTTPDRVLYVGDHIFGDVLRANKSSAWRTALVVQEMSAELDAHADVVHSLERLDTLDEIRSQLTDDLRQHQGIVRTLQKKKDQAGLTPAYEAERVRHKRAADRLRTRLRATEREYEELDRGVSQRFHPFWGSLFKAGGEQSSFGHQAEHYAMLYTSRVSNFLRYSPMHFFQSPRDRMPHEL